jgi:hypothetical protein
MGVLTRTSGFAEAYTLYLTLPLVFGCWNTLICRFDRFLLVEGSFCATTRAGMANVKGKRGSTHQLSPVHSLRPEARQETSNCRFLKQKTKGFKRFPIRFPQAVKPHFLL